MEGRARSATTCGRCARRGPQVSVLGAPAGLAPSHRPMSDGPRPPTALCRRLSALPRLPPSPHPVLVLGGKDRGDCAARRVVGWHPRPARGGAAWAGGTLPGRSLLPADHSREHLASPQVSMQKASPLLLREPGLAESLRHWLPAPGGVRGRGGKGRPTVLDPCFMQGSDPHSILGPEVQPSSVLAPAAPSPSPRPPPRQPPDICPGERSGRNSRKCYCTLS